jgi:hypothetical protein
MRGHAIHMLGRQPGDEVGVAAHQGLHAPLGGWDRAEHDAVEVEAPAPIIRIRLEDAPVPFRPGHEAKRTGSDRSLVERRVPDAIDVRPGDDVTRERELREQEHVRLLGVDDEGLRVGSLRPVDRLEHGQEARGLHGGVEHPIETVLGVGGCEPSAVVPAYVWPQGEVPCRRPRAAPHGCQRGVERAIGMASHEGVEDVADDPDVARVLRRMGIQNGQITWLEHDELPPLRGVAGRPRGAGA